jgi:hypothetical protein
LPDEWPASVERGVAQLAKVAACIRSCGPPLRAISLAAPPAVRTFFAPTVARAVGQLASFAAPGSFNTGLSWFPWL